jgi:enoyl-CoA hydratase/carnithine racemase
MHEHGFLNEVVAASAFADRIAYWAGAFDGVSRGAVARTKAMLIARHGELLDAAMAREEQACIELFESEDARAALRSFAARRRAK